VTAVTTGGAGPGLRTPGPLLLELLRTARPKQWAKNVLVFAAPAAAGVLDEWSAQWRSLVAFAAFCAAASGTYFLNDVADVEADRAHPRKRNRPIALGSVPVPLGTAVGVLLLALAVGLAAATGHPEMVVVVGLYVAMTVTYTWWWKHVAVVDLVVVAMGFVLRAVGGGVAVDVAISDWFLITTSFASLFVVAGKRHADLAALGNEAGGTRALLDTYTLPFLRMVLAVSLGAAVVGYCLWAFEASETAGSSWPLFELSIVPMVTALLRYALLLDGGHGSAPEEVFAGDRALQVLGGTWAVLFLAGVYVG
jgi:decaprenyl-phosphate phosphoribosyltransferase